MIFASFAEVLSIGAVLPFLAAIAAPDRIFQHAYAQPFIEFLELTAPDQLLWPLALVFCLAALVAAAVRLTVLWASTRLAFAAGADLSIDIYRRTLFQPYSVHIARNSSEIIASISIKANGVIHVSMLCLNFISASTVLVAILIALLCVDPHIAIAAIGGFGTIYLAIAWFSRERLIRNSERGSRASTQVVKSLQEGLGGIRDILINGSQNAYCEVYRHAEIPWRRAQGDSAIISASPRYVMEALVMILIAMLAYALVQRSDGIANAIPILGALAMGAQRTLPVLQQAYGAWSGVRSEGAALEDILGLLDQPLPEYATQGLVAPLAFNEHIRLEDVAFRYGAETAWVLHDLNLTIPKGACVGFIGVTGGGKSTLLDILMGLLPPTSGTLIIDGQSIGAANHRAWQAHIAHVPQAIFLADRSIEENIALGLSNSEIDPVRVRLAAKQAQIADVIEALPRQYQTTVGERGIRLSGGQRQRIGIARALYKDPSVIIFDEATSALDSETEQAVMEAIEGLSHSLTILIVAHRLTTLKSCSLIVEIGAQGIIRTGSYQEIIAASAA